MAEIRWTHQAADDLESITEFISQDSPHYARLFALDIIEAVERLVDFPELGRLVPEKDDPLFREIIIRDIPGNLWPLGDQGGDPDLLRFWECCVSHLRDRRAEKALG